MRVRSRLTTHRGSAHWTFVGALALFALGGGRSPSIAQIDASGTLAPSSQMEPLSIDPPASSSTFPAISVEEPTSASKEQEILLTWASPTASGSRLMFSRLSGRTWSTPVTIVEKVSASGPADRPSLTVIDTQSVRRTLIAQLGNFVARSGDGGRSWDRLPAPDLSFASFAGADEGAYAFWQVPSEAGSAKLMGTRVLAGETLLDPQIAAGSGTAAAMTWDGPIVVYRDRNEAGAQDIAIVRRQDGRWTAPLPVSAEGWRPAKTPSSGPEVAAYRRQVAVAWYSETRGLPGLRVAFSSDAGRTFGAPIEVDARVKDRSPWGPVDVALDDKGQALVLWLAVTGAAETTLNLARVAPDGKRGEALVIAKGLLSSAQGAPQMVVAGERVAVTWVEGGPEPRVRAVTVLFAGIPAALKARPSVAPVPAPELKPYAGRGRVGDPVPDLPLLTLAGEKVSFPSLRGRVVLLNLWATWCAPCLAEMPELAALEARYRARGLSVVGVNGDVAGMRDKVRAFVDQRKIPFAVWLDPEMSINRAMRVVSLPTNFVIDRQGNIVLRLDRPISANDSELQKSLDDALGSPR